jgi:hypothetical protein
MTWLRMKLLNCASEAFAVGLVSSIVDPSWAAPFLGHSEMGKDFVFLKKDLFIHESPANHASLGIT